MYSIGISTYKNRFDKYFIPLMNSLEILKQHDIEKHIFVNSPLKNKDKTDEKYLQDIMRFCSKFSNTHLIMSPIFRGCSKMWNSMIVNSSHDNILILNDDVQPLPQFFESYNDYMQKVNSSFIINGSFSHFSINRKNIKDVGYFDERLIAIGEEDGDFLNRWYHTYKKNIPDIKTNTIINHVDSDNKNNFVGLRKNENSTHKQYPLFNSEIVNKKYTVSTDRSKLDQGKTIIPLRDAGNYAILNDNEFGKTPDFYPAETFYWENIKNV